MNIKQFFVITTSQRGTINIKCSNTIFIYLNIIILEWFKKKMQYPISLIILFLNFELEKEVINKLSFLLK